MTLPLNILLLITIAYAWAIIALNIGYPLRPLIGMGGDTRHAWDGLTYAGVWLVHGVGGGVTTLLAMTVALARCDGVTGVDAGSAVGRRLSRSPLRSRIPVRGRLPSRGEA